MKTPRLHLLTTKQTAFILGVSQRTLEGWRRGYPRFLPFIRLGSRMIRYDAGIVEEFIRLQRVAVEIEAPMPPREEHKHGRPVHPLHVSFRPQTHKKGKTE
ncbi:MAG: helix-turn-helix domain-containing protein [Candidatus Acidiferrum sp.]